MSEQSEQSEQFDDRGFPVDTTKTELRLTHRSAFCLSVAFRQACREIDILEKKLEVSEATAFRPGIGGRSTD